jgi:adenylylsulfate kinase
VLWFTGLSGAGKSTLAHTIEGQLHQQGCRTFVLDGDNVRLGLSSDLGFSKPDRKENIRRIGETAKMMMEAGIITLTAFISPYQKDRESIRNLMPHGDFIEIYCKATLEICEERDVKGLYKKAREGEIKNYTGINSPYEAPCNPELTIDTGSENVENSTGVVIKFLQDRGILQI